MRPLAPSTGVLLAAALLAGCADADAPAPPEQETSENPPAGPARDAPGAPGEPATEPAIDPARAAEIRRLRQGSSGPTTPVYDPDYADEPGRSFETADEAADYLEARERQRARDAAK